MLSKYYKVQNMIVVCRKTDFHSKIQIIKAANKSSSKYFSLKLESEELESSFRL
jgi:hypothetical protein